MNLGSPAYSDFVCILKNGSTEIHKHQYYKVTSRFCKQLMATKPSYNITMDGVPRVLVFLVLAIGTSRAGYPILASYPGDILLAGFFPVHNRNSNAREANDVCGEILETDGIQTMEALFFALDDINNSGLLPGIKLGALIFDSCNDENTALEQALDLIRILMMKTDSDTQIMTCEDGSEPVLTPEAQEYYKVVGVVGASSSSVSIQLASLLRLFHIPQISYISTSSDLSNRERYDYFRRTVPSDDYQANAIIQLLKSFNWTYVSVVYEETNYGMKGFAELERVAREEGVCFAYTTMIDMDDPVEDKDYENIIHMLLLKERARAVVAFIAYPRARELFLAAARVGEASKQLTWVGPDGWSGRQSVVAGVEEYVHMAVTVQPLAYRMEQFDDYFTELSPGDGNLRNPWFTEFWEHHFNCTINDYSTSVTKADSNKQKKHSSIDVSITSGVKYGLNKPSAKMNNVTKKSSSAAQQKCTGDEKISSESGYYQQSSLHFVRDATLAFAHALRQLHNATCGVDYVGICDDFSPSNISGSQLNDYIGNAHFEGTAGLNFSFVNDVDGPPRYTIKTFRADTSPGWSSVGSISAVAGEDWLVFDPDFESIMDQYNTSVCSEPCKLDQAKQVSPQDPCCWFCTSCSRYDIVVDNEGRERCEECPQGQVPDSTRRNCSIIEVTFITYDNPWAYGAIIIAMVGITATIATTVIFIIYSNTPVVKASGRELSFYLLGAVLLAFLSTFVYVAPPNNVTCGLTRILLGLCHTMIYGSILTKTNRISRIFNDGTGSPKKARYTSPRSQILIVNMLLCPQLLLLIGWMAAEPPATSHVYPSRDSNILVCSGSQNADYMIGLVYPFILLILSAYYAFKTRKTPSGFNESRLIAFTAYTTFVIWLAFVPTYFTTKSTYLKAFTMSIGGSMSAFVVLGCLFVPKIYICIMRPEKNTRDAIMRRTNSVLSSVPPSNSDHDMKTLALEVDLKQIEMNSKDKHDDHDHHSPQRPRSLSHVSFDLSKDAARKENSKKTGSILVNNNHICKYDSDVINECAEDTRDGDVIEDHGPDIEDHGPDIGYDITSPSKRKKCGSISEHSTCSESSLVEDRDTQSVVHRH